MTGAQQRYCAKVGIAAGLGYLLTQGNLNQYAICSAFTAALVVGTSIGEDLATSANRVKGTLAGTAAAMVATAQVTSTLRLGLDVLSCALNEPRADSLRDLRERLDHVASTTAT